MSARAEQRALFTADLEADADPKDSWATAPEVVDIAHKLWPEGIGLDPCANASSIALGFVRARVAWRKADDCMAQPTWDVVQPRTTCWYQPPYSREGAPITADWARRWDAGQTWETLALVRLDTSTDSWRALESRASSLVLFRDRLDHYEAGVRKTQSNICSAMLLMTRADPTVRQPLKRRWVPSETCTGRGAMPRRATTSDGEQSRDDDHDRRLDGSGRDARSPA